MKKKIYYLIADLFYHMRIDEIKTSTKVASARLVDNIVSKKWELVWEKDINNLLSQSLGRVYLITSNGVIKKIGGSMDKGGILGTLGWYENKALSGGPSIRTYGIHILIYEELLKGNIIEFHCVWSEKILSPVKGLFGEEELETNIDFKTMENKCKNDYISIMGTLPDWNFQEGGKKWPIYISEGCNLVNQTSTSKRKKEKNENPS